jgi:GcrA cell cycle regulator
MSKPAGANQYKTDWADARVVLLKLRWKNGATASQIAAELGCSRNAVIGKAHRLGLDRRAPSPAPKRPREKLVKPAATPPAEPAHKHAGNPWGWNGKVRPTPPVAPMEVSTATSPKPVHIHDRNMLRECGWPLWRDRAAYSDLLCCGNPIARGEPSYCECHLRVSLRRAA